MDTEEKHHLEKLALEGRSPTDEGPYYHQAWWESYKGGVKGLLGGMVIGAGVGLAIGGAVVGALALASSTAIPAGTIGLTLAGFSAFGMIEGAYKFTNVGTVTGAVAASHEISERRMKEFEGSKFAELKKEIRQMKAALLGKGKADELNAIADATAEKPKQEYRTQHIDGHDTLATIKEPVFWKVAAIGAGVGAAAGMLLGYTAGDEMLKHFPEVVKHGLGVEITTAAPIIGAGIGASFGINRDMFRAVFDVTDRWFKGLVGYDHAREQEKLRAQTLAEAKSKDIPVQKQPERQLNTSEPVLISVTQEMQKSETFFQDKLKEAAARQLLLSMDHTTAIRQ